MFLQLHRVGMFGLISEREDLKPVPTSNRAKQDDPEVSGGPFP